MRSPPGLKSLVTHHHHLCDSREYLFSSIPDVFTSHAPKVTDSVANLCQNETTA